MSRPSRPRLLVADDDLGVIAAYRHVLERDEFSRSAPSTSELEVELFGAQDSGEEPEIDWRVDFVDQGDDAVTSVRVAMANSDPYSAVFLDIRMPPGIDGYETATLIRAIDTDVHIVFVSAYSDYTEDELLQATNSIHKTSFMPKPVWPQELKATATACCKEADLLALLRSPFHGPAKERKIGT